MLILSVLWSFLQVGSCADGDWGVRPKGPLGSSVEAVDGDSGSNSWTVPGKDELDKKWTVAEKNDDESSTSGSETSGSSDSDSEGSPVPVKRPVPVVKTMPPVKPSVVTVEKVDPESRRHEEQRQPAVDRTAQLTDFVSKHSEDIQTVALICCGLIAIAICAPFIIALLGGVSVGAVVLGITACLCSPVIIAVACCCCCLMLLGYGHK